MVKKLSCGSCGSLKRFPHTFTTANLAHLPQWAKGAELEVQFSCELQNGPQDFIFFNCHGCQTIILAEIHCYLSPPKVEKIIYS